MNLASYFLQLLQAINSTKEASFNFLSVIMLQNQFTKQKGLLTWKYPGLTFADAPTKGRNFDHLFYSISQISLKINKNRRKTQRNMFRFKFFKVKMKPRHSLQRKSKTIFIVSFQGFSQTFRIDSIATEKTFQFRRKRLNLRYEKTKTCSKFIVRFLSLPQFYFELKIKSGGTI